MAFLVLIFIPLLIAVGTFIFLDTVSWKEFLVQVGAQVLVAGISVYAIYSSNTSDVEVWSGVVTGKEQVRVSCGHSYQCNCRSVRSCSGSGKSRSCSYNTVCDTCYEHSNDWDWDVHTSLGNTITIDRVDRRGSYEPPRWGSVRTGEPVAVRHHYTNYIKAAPGSLFRHQGQLKNFKKLIPTYPNKVYDYYRLNRLVLVNGAKVDDPEDWNRRLSEINGRLGHAKQVNIIVMVTRDLPSEFFFAVEQAWIGGKKNDVVLMVNVDSESHPTWARVMAWTTNKEVEVKLADATMDLPKITREALLPIVEENVKRYYVRKPMHDFEYLMASVTPSTSQWIFTILLGILVAIGLAVLMHRQDIFGDEGPRRRFNP